MMSVFANQESLFIRSSMLRNRAETWVKDNKLIMLNASTKELNHQ